MAISTQLWKNQIQYTLKRISDENYQRLSWFGLHPTKISSPDEEINQLYSDFGFKDDFIESDCINLFDGQKKAAWAFCALLDKFCKETPMDLNPAEVINDPRWAKIREEAGKLIPILFPGK